MVKAEAILGLGLSLSLNLSLMEANMPVLRELPAWQALDEHQKEIVGVHMRDLFAQDPQRFERFSLRLERHPIGLL